MINVHYSYREGDAKEPTHFSSENATIEQVMSILTEYPWDTEGDLPTEEHAGGGIFVEITNHNKQEATFQIVPFGCEHCMLFANVVLKKGFLGIFGKQSVSKDFEELTPEQAIERIKPFLSISVPSIYEELASI
ncbi:hypothetical protein [Vibrio nigripulchritudo]|uniref:hypothetical protein n=1 Tax=Vibrio nigripulchritudo TaxID=28173 RepID=UPI0005F9D173|nr:hypothetical protein [Vibrio nigripulchritudo]KJY72122.1 hypothetical protein TW74_22615 [Vibrio nigripulchritudo]